MLRLQRPIMVYFALKENLLPDNSIIYRACNMFSHVNFDNIIYINIENKFDFDRVINNSFVVIRASNENIFDFKLQSKIMQLLVSKRQRDINIALITDSIRPSFYHNADFVYIDKNIAGFKFFQEYARQNKILHQIV